MLADPRHWPHMPDCDNVSCTKIRRHMELIAVIAKGQMLTVLQTINCT